MRKGLVAFGMLFAARAHAGEDCDIEDIAGGTRGTAMGELMDQCPGCNPPTGVLPLRMTLRSQSQDNFRSVFRTFRFALFESHDRDGQLEALPAAIEAMYPDGIGTDAAPLPPSSWLVRLDPVAFALARDGMTIEASLGDVWASQALACVACAPVAGKLAIARGAGALAPERPAHLPTDERV